MKVAQKKLIEPKKLADSKAIPTLHQVRSKSKSKPSKYISKLDDDRPSATVKTLIKKKKKGSIYKPTFEKMVETGVRQKDIAKFFHVTKQAVSGAIHEWGLQSIALEAFRKNRTNIALIRQMKATFLNEKVMDELNERLDSNPEGFSNKEITELWGKAEVIEDRAFIRERLLLGQSTSNIEMLMKALLPFRRKNVTEVEFIEHAIEQVEK